MVVPQGSGLSDGSLLDWGSVDNVTVVATIPNIIRPSGTVYAILSLMTSGGAVMQTALGVYPGSTTWLGYTLFIDGLQQMPQTYHWVANSSQPDTQPNQTVALTLAMDREGLWTYRLTNTATHSSVSGGFGQGATGPLVRADQEVFALESYSSAASTFSTMGNMTVEGVYLNGARATGPLYTYGGWDPSHSLPFVVGGSNPPDFIGVVVSVGGAVSWSFTGTVSNWSYDGRAPLAFLGAIGITAMVTAVVGAVRLISKKAGQDRSETRTVPE